MLIPPSRCVPKVAPTQANESVEYTRAKEATKMSQDVLLVNEQVRGAEETRGKAHVDATVAPSRSPKAERAMKKFGGSPKCYSCEKVRV